jgi:hypothetical protein
MPEHHRPELKHRQYDTGADHPLAHPCPPTPRPRMTW